MHLAAATLMADVSAPCHAKMCILKDRYGVKSKGENSIVRLDSCSIGQADEYSECSPKRLCPSDNASKYRGAHKVCLSTYRKGFRYPLIDMQPKPQGYPEFDTKRLLRAIN